MRSRAASGTPLHAIASQIDQGRRVVVWRYGIPNFRYDPADGF